MIDFLFADIFTILFLCDRMDSPLVVLSTDVCFQMASIYMLLLSALVLSCEVSCGQVFDGDLNEESEDSSDWYDPTDMINYDLASGRMRNTRHSQVLFYIVLCVFLFLINSVIVNYVIASPNSDTVDTVVMIFVLMFCYDVNVTSVL